MRLRLAGQQATERWEGRDRRRIFVYERAEQAVSGHVDTRRVLLLDVNYTNNSWTLAPRGPQAATRWALKWMLWLQDALLTWGFLA